MEVMPMFLDFYHLSEQPFGVTPDPAYLYPSRTHCEALSSLTSGILAARGFLALIAHPGMGKTTLLYELLDELRDSARTAFLFQTQCDSREFFSYVLTELGIDAQGLGLVEMHNKLNELLFDEMLNGKRFVLIVDEAQNLDESVLETVRLLSNFETPHTKLLQIILAGQPQLAAKLAKPSLSQLRQRIAVLAHLQPLTPEETAGYIQHRLKVAGYRGEPLFSPDALGLIARRSRGIPRNINNICYDVLAAAHARGSRTITTTIVQEVIGGLDMPSLISQPLEPRPTAPRVGAGSGIAANTTLDAGGDRRPAASLSPKAPGADPIAATSVPGRNKTTPPLTYEPGKHSGLARRALRAAGLTSILLFAGLSLLPSALTRLESSRSSASALAAPLAVSNIASGPANYLADPQETGSGQILTVIAEPQQTLKEISLLYVGHFDGELLKEICALNPELKDPDHIQPGQLIRLPLPPGTLKKVYDAAEAGDAPKAEASDGLLAKLSGFLYGKK
jgi:type II secretory pathway predicted ATPase ExeA